MKLWWLETRLLLKNRAVRWLGAAYLVMMMLAVGVGYARFQGDDVAGEALKTRMAAEQAAWRHKVVAQGPGSAGYYLFLPAVFAPSPWSALFGGERASHLTQQRVRLLAVHGQIHGGPIRNPELAVIGDLDLGFVWAYLLPLLIGLISVTFVADDRRRGRWSMLQALTDPVGLVLRRLLIRFGSVLLLNSALLVAAAFVAALPWETRLGVVWLLLVLYQAFWFCVAALVLQLGRNAHQSILVYVAVWVLSVWLVPALHTMSKLETEHFNQGVEMLVLQRQDMNDSWDRDKQADFDAFLATYPQWAETSPLVGRFNWKWYYAMQKASDDKVNHLFEAYTAAREHTGSPWRLLSPTLVLQGALEDLADTSARDQVAYLRELVAWHREKQAFWFPYLFNDKPFAPDDINRIPAFAFQPDDAPTTGTLGYLAGLILVAGLVGTLQHLRARRARTLPKLGIQRDASVGA
ncbi:DUF3526 domain-containing protein [Acanthopleuribacter pedis]|uniref:DUF3526 domain-containing protein n=1 Tax=Acanthopleuribacter pedis TaxID=442870 RepID=A0A8J7U4X6_9BACT|nr:DUF3526 domain-containing protein [Acanthopleuribacter pedis]MBO1321933.1 DUF3526 domain-containing protein [Acanthopleuribacter pedis]